MNCAAQISHWESDVLGFRVGTLKLEDGFLPDENTIRNANRDRFDVVFVRYNGWADPHGQMLALDYLYDMEAAVTPHKVGISLVSVMSYPGKRHLEIAAEAFADSRFLRDPLLSARSPNRYVRWLSENRSYIPTEAPDDAFVVVQDDPDGARRISLIAVAADRRSGGLGERLLKEAFCMEPTRNVWRVRVSARNHRAMRFYERLWFRVKSVSTNFHVWTGGPLG